MGIKRFDCRLLPFSSALHKWHMRKLLPYQWVAHPRRAIEQTVHLLLGILCLLSECCAARPAAPFAENIDSLVQEQMRSFSIPGLQIAVTSGESMVFSASYGSADLESRTPVTRDTLFRIGSITKPITATAALILEQNHQLDLDKPAQTYCRSFPATQWPVTPRELLGHTSGIRGFRAGEKSELFNEAHYETLGESLALFENDALIAQPGTRYVYSHYGYDVIGCVLEAASGKPFPELLQTLIFSPAGMTAIRQDDARRIIPGRSRSYTHAKDGSIANARCIDSSNRIPAAGLLSSAEDLARFVLALQGVRLLSLERVHRMWAQQSTLDGKDTGYGLGWMMHDHNGIKAVAHTGEEPGASTILYVMPDDGASFAILANTDAAGLWKLADKIADLLHAANQHKSR
jgi:CubicO group peptidase (beta-lactamase class C family)